MFEVLGNGVFALLGVLAGWILNELSTNRRLKPRLCFKLSNTPDDEISDCELRTKTSSSEYSIEIFNVGQSPFVLESFGLYHRKRILVDCHILDEEKVVMPYSRKRYVLSEQELNALERHCEEKSLKHCKVLAWDVDGKNIKAKMDVSWITLRAELRNTNMFYNK